ncbi:aldehyde dehydrogenase [Fusarium avenaceum]|nr:aldehyde dehydrogenase [Fusarium avenaceum]
MEQFWALNTMQCATDFISKNADQGELPTLENYVGDDPKTGRAYVRISISDAPDVDAAVIAAKEAFPAWSRTSRKIRSGYLQKIATLLEENKELFAVWESIDQGQTIQRARIEVDRAVSNFQYFSTFILHEDHRARMKIAPCLVFGCTAVAKPSEVTSMTAYLLSEIFRRVKLPAGVVNMVFGDGATTGSALLSHPGIHGISFTGGTATGIQIYKHLSLELGGKNPTLVFDDVDMDEAICLCGSRIYIQSCIFDEFVAKFKTHTSHTHKIKNTVGAVVSLTHYNKIRSYLKIAEAEGAKFELGQVPLSEPRAGYWIDLVVLPGVKQGSRVAGLVWVNCWLVRELGVPFAGMKNSGVGREGGEYSREVFTNVRTLHLAQ